LSRAEKIRNYAAASMLALSAVSSTLLLLSYLSAGANEFSYKWISSIGANLEFNVDGLSVFMVVIVTWLSFLIGFYSLKYMEGDKILTRYWFFFSFFVGSMILLVLADNLIIMFIGWEGTGLASYALIGHWYTDDRSWVGDPERKVLGVSMHFSPSHSGLRALIFTRVGDVGFIIGVAVLLVFTGTANITGIADSSNAWTSILLNKKLLFPFLILFSLGAFAKSAQFPFHEWLVTAMTGPTSVSALIHAATMVKAGVYFMLRFMPIFYLASRLVPNALPDYNFFFITIASIGAFTAFFMATQAMVTKEIKLVLAFSTASQLGYMFLGVGAAGLIHEFFNGFLATFTFLMSHAIFKGCLFLAAGAILHAIESKYMTDAGGLRRYMPFTFIAMLLATFSLVGIPPFMGFWTKDGLLEIVYEANLLPQYILGVITVSLTAFYSSRLIFITFLGNETKHLKEMKKEHGVNEAHSIMLTPYLILAFIPLLVGLAWPFMSGNLLTVIVKHVLAIEEVSKVSFHMTPLLTVLSLSMALIGLAASFFIYVKPRYVTSLNTTVQKSPFLYAMRNLLYDRYYLNSIYYIIVVKGGKRLSNGLFKWFDRAVIDQFYNILMPTGWMRLSNGLFKWFDRAVIDQFYNISLPSGVIIVGQEWRRWQSGRINHYLLSFLLGLIFFLIIIVFVMV
jgi:NADH-quinone oxidoreductase subunit L